MKLNKISLLFVLFLGACSSKENKSSAVPTDTISIDTVATATTEPQDELNPTGDEIREFGLLKEVEDSGYPILTLTIEFPERKITEYFTLNLEEVKSKDAEPTILRNWTGKYLSFLYKSELQNALLDVRVNGKSITSDEKVDLNPEVKKIVGVLSGATEETPGDLPGTVSITSKDNVKLDFDFFVTPQMVNANNTKVVGYYEERPANIITAIQLSK